MQSGRAAGCRPRASTLAASLRKVGALPCDVVISTHPAATGMDDRLAARASGGFSPGGDGDPFVDPGACAALAERSMRALDDRAASESRPQPGTSRGSF